jgi:hypothetical protein
MNFTGFARARSSLVREERRCPVIRAVYLVDPQEAVDFYRFSSELDFQGVGGTVKWRSARFEVASDHDLVIWGYACRCAYARVLAI